MSAAGPDDLSSRRPFCYKVSESFEVQGWGVVQGRVRGGWWTCGLEVPVVFLMGVLLMEEGTMEEGTSRSDHAACFRALKSIGSR